MTGLPEIIPVFRAVTVTTALLLCFWELSVYLSYQGVTASGFFDDAYGWKDKSQYQRRPYMGKRSIFDKAGIESACEEFYSLYDVTKGRTLDMCRAKQEHIRQVAKNCYTIAEAEGLDEYDRDLSWVIGELHDFARFGQVISTSSFFSEGFDHARLGARILFTHGMVKDIILNFDDISDEDKAVMEKAVYYHSAFELPQDLTDRECLFCEIIRQADRADIFRFDATNSCETVLGHTEEELLASDISDSVLECYQNHKMCDYSKNVTIADYYLSSNAICFGITFPSAKKMVLDQGYLWKLVNVTFTDSETEKKYRRAKESVKEFFNV